MSWFKTSFTERLQIRYPIVQAPMPDGITTPQLVAAVSNVGGLGTLAAGHLQPAQLRALIKETRKLTNKPFAVNLLIPEKPPHIGTAQIDRVNQLLAPFHAELGLVPVTPSALDHLPLFREQLAAVLEEQVDILSFTFGVPQLEDMVLFKEHGVIVMGTATHLLEAIVLEESGVDIVIAQGAEAGGHRATFLGTFEQGLVGSIALLPLLAHHIRVPLLASGGIMDGRAMVAALALGAAGVQVGTAFLTCPESGAHPSYKALLPEGTEITTVLTRSISGKPARVLSNRFVAELKAHVQDLPEYPLQQALTQTIRQAAANQERPEFMALWAGQGCALCSNKPAAELVHEWTKQINQITAGLKLY